MNMPLDIATSAQTAEDCMRELAETMLGVEECKLVEVESALPNEVHGSYCALINGSSTLQVGVFADAEGLQALTRALLQMDDDEALEREDVADAVGEIVNVLAGALKEKLGSAGDDVSMGLPVFVQGTISAPRSANTQTLLLNLDDLSVSVTLVLGSTAAGQR